MAPRRRTHRTKPGTRCRRSRRGHPTVKMQRTEKTTGCVDIRAEKVRRHTDKGNCCGSILKFQDGKMAAPFTALQPTLLCVLSFQLRLPIDGTSNLSSNRRVPHKAPRHFGLTTSQYSICPLQPPVSSYPHDHPLRKYHVEQQLLIVLRHANKSLPQVQVRQDSNTSTSRLTTL